MTYKSPINFGILEWIASCATIVGLIFGYTHLSLITWLLILAVILLIALFRIFLNLRSSHKDTIVQYNKLVKDHDTLENRHKALSRQFETRTLKLEEYEFVYKN